MSEWVDCPICGCNHENLTRCPEPAISMSIDEKEALGVDSDFMTDPLSGMLSKPAHLYTEQELDDFVQRTRQMRNSTQMMKAEMQKDVAKVKTEPKSKAVVKVDTKALNDLLDL